MIKYFGDREKEYKDPICASLGCNRVPDEGEEYCRFHIEKNKEFVEMEKFYGNCER